MTMNEFLGNDTLKETFLSFFKEKKVPHSMIFEGPCGMGKKTFAKIVAQNAVCGHAAPLACGSCLNCQKVSKGIHPDVIYPEKSGALNTYNVATVREIRRDAYILPNEADCKVYMFLDANNMNASSQNALLKVIEEPPKNVIFIFTCESSKNFLDTIKSRSQIFKLAPPPEDESLEFLKRKFPDLQASELEKFLHLAAGNVGKALQLLQDGNQKNEYLVAESLLKTVVVPNEAELLRAAAKIKNDRESVKLVLNFLFEFLKTAFEFSVGARAEADDVSKNIAKKISVEKIMRLLDFVNEMVGLVNKNVNFNLLITHLTANLYNIVFSV